MQREVILCVGKTGTGKTTWARNFIREKTRVVVCEAGFGEFGLPVVPDFDSLLSHVRRGFFRVSYSPRWFEFASVFEMSENLGKSGGPLWLVLEEADRLDPPRQFPQYDDAINRGRHWGLNLIALTTRPAKLPPDYRAQATRVIAFRQHEPRDLEYLSEIMGDKAYALPNLKRFENMEWSEKDSWTPGRSSESQSERLLSDLPPTSRGQEGKENE